MPPSPSRARAGATGRSYRDKWCLQLSIIAMAQSAPSAWTAPPVSKSALGRWAGKGEIGVSMGRGRSGGYSRARSLPTVLSLLGFLSLNGILGRCRQQASGRSPCCRLGLGVSPCTPGFGEEFSAPCESFVYKTQPLYRGRVLQAGLECWSPGTGAAGWGCSALARILVADQVLQTGWRCCFYVEVLHTAWVL